MSIRRASATGGLAPFAGALILATVVAAGCSADVSRFSLGSAFTTGATGPLPFATTKTSANGPGSTYAPPKGLAHSPPPTETVLPPLKQPPKDYRVVGRNYAPPPTSPPPPPPPTVKQPPAAKEPPPPPPPSSLIVEVQPGDTLYGIARRYGVTASAVKETQRPAEHGGQARPAAGAASGGKGARPVRESRPVRQGRVPHRRGHGREALRRQGAACGRGRPASVPASRGAGEAAHHQGGRRAHGRRQGKDGETGRHGDRCRAAARRHERQIPLAASRQGDRRLRPGPRRLEERRHQPGGAAGNRCPRRRGRPRALCGRWTERLRQAGPHPARRRLGHRLRLRRPDPGQDQRRGEAWPGDR